MIDEPAIRAAVERIVAAGRPSKVILFGSYARGDADDGSDLDLLVIQSRVVDAAAEIARLRTAIGDVGVGVDLLVYSEDEVARRGLVAGTAIWWALGEGRVVYEAFTPRTAASDTDGTAATGGRAGGSRDRTAAGRGAGGGSA
jgi:predicted nucleotidyltransferase